MPTAKPAKQPGGCTGKGFVPGQSGNPGGRPKGQSLTARLRELFDDESRDAFLRGLIQSGIEGDVKAHKLVFQLLEPKSHATEAADSREALLAAAEAVVNAKLSSRPQSS